MEVGLIFLIEWCATNLVYIIVLEDATSGIESVVNLLYLAEVGYVQCAYNVGSDGFLSIGLAPVNIGSSSDTWKL